jgi:capsular polysaccharide biosynthesis protein
VEKQEIDIHTLAVAVRRRWRVVVVGVLVGILCATALNFVIDKAYEGRSSVLIRRVGETNTPEGAMATDAALARSVPVATRVVEILGLATEPVDFVETYSVTPITDDVLQFRVKSPTAAGAAAAADALADEFLAFRDQQNDAQLNIIIRSLEDQRVGLESRLEEIATQLATLPAAERPRLENQQDQLNEELSALNTRVADARLQSQLASDGSQILERAELPRSPVQPKTTFNLAVGIMLGAAAAVALISFSEIVSDKARSRDDIAGAAGAPVVASAILGRRNHPTRIDDAVGGKILGAPSTELVRALDAIADSMGDTATGRIVMAPLDCTSEGAVLTAVLADHLNYGGLSATLVEVPSSKAMPLARFLDSVHRLEPGSKLPSRLDRTDSVLLLHPVGDEDDHQLWKPETLDRTSVRWDRADVDDDSLLVGFVPIPHDSDLPHLSELASGSLLLVVAGRTSGPDVRRAAQVLRRAGTPLVGVVVVQPDRFDRTTGQL